MKDKKVGAILLAAGNSSRFGANKLLYEIEGNPLVQYSMEIISQLPFEQKIVVGHDDLTSSPPSSSLSLAVSFEFPAGPLATKDKGCARCGT